MTRCQVCECDLTKRSHYRLVGAYYCDGCWERRVMREIREDMSPQKGKRPEIGTKEKYRKVKKSELRKGV